MKVSTYDLVGIGQYLLQFSNKQLSVNEIKEVFKPCGKMVLVVAFHRVAKEGRCFTAVPFVAESEEPPEIVLSRDYFACFHKFHTITDRGKLIWLRQK